MLFVLMCVLSGDGCVWMCVDVVDGVDGVECLRLVE